MFHSTLFYSVPSTQIEPKGFFSKEKQTLTFKPPQYPQCRNCIKYHPRECIISKMYFFFRKTKKTYRVGFPSCNQQGRRIQCAVVRSQKNNIGWAIKINDNICKHKTYVVINIKHKSYFFKKVLNTKLIIKKLNYIS